MSAGRGGFLDKCTDTKYCCGFSQLLDACIILVQRCVKRQTHTYLETDRYMEDSSGLGLGAGSVKVLALPP